MRMIDANALIERMKNTWDMQDLYLPVHFEDLVEDEPTVGGWISVKDSLPEEHESIFHKLLGTPKWSSAMWQQESDKVLVTVAFKDGTKIVTTGATRDGVWNTSISRALEPVVTHWQEMPEPPKEGETEC